MPGTWSYVPEDLASSPRDAVRLLCGDTDAANPLIYNEEIDYLLTLNANVYQAAALACDSIASKFAAYSDTRVGDVSVSLRGVGESFLAKAKSLRSQAARSAAIPYAGGLSKSEKDTNEADTDRVPPYFTRTLGDFPGFPLLAQSGKVTRGES